MLIKTKGIVLKNIPYGETSVISKIFTAQIGLQSYIINGVRSAKHAGKAVLLQPLSIIEIVAYYRANKQLERVTEIKGVHQLNSIPFHIHKQTIIMFMNEVLLKVIHEHEPLEHLFYFIEQFILTLDAEKECKPNTPILFLIELSKHLGFYTPLAEIDTNTNALYGYALQKNEIELLSEIKKDEHYINNRYKRKVLMQIILKMYQTQVPNFGILKSPEVLEAVFD
jgi:DNA repair protein RecO (recombination protein O)